MSKVFCPMVYHSIYVRRTADGSHSLSPCCLADQSTPTSDKIDFINNKHLIDIRKEFSSGGRPTACRSCWDDENHGRTSARQQHIDMDIIPSDESLSLYNIDYNTLPLCNAKCVICNSTFSSMWATANGESSRIIDLVKNKYDHLDGLELSSIKRVYFNGGEPLLTNEHVELLQRVNNISELDILYNTNGSCYPSEQALNLWKQAKSVTLFFSIDGTGDRFEETRTPLKWKQVSENIKKINLIKNIRIGCTYTIGRHNVYDLQDTVDWFEKLPNFDLEEFYVHYVDTNHSLSFNNASDTEKLEFANELSKFSKFTKWHQRILSSIED